MKKELISIIVQGWYGNRTGTEINKEKVDTFIRSGGTDSTLLRGEEDGRTVVRIPDSEQIVLVYNKYSEERRLKDKERYYREEGYVLKPLAAIPEMGVEIYSRCIVCRMNENGEFFSLQGNDWEKFGKYLAY